MKAFSKSFTLIAFSLACTSASICNAQMPEETGDMHAHHHMVMEQTKHQLADYKLPRIQLVREDGKNIDFLEELNDGRPVIMNFIYTTCTTICPLASRTLAELQEQLGSEGDSIHLASVSIDPEQDTPAVLAKYANRFGAGKQWHFYTGTVDASVAAQRAFDVYRGDKMDHNPVTFIRAAPGTPWMRIDGFAKADELLRELRDLKADMQSSKEARLPEGAH